MARGNGSQSSRGSSELEDPLIDGSESPAKAWHGGDKLTTAQMVVSVCAIIIMLLSWCASTEAIQWLESASGKFNQPFLLVWMNHSVLIVLTPVALLLYNRQRKAHSVDAHTMLRVAEATAQPDNYGTPQPSTAMSADGSGSDSGSDSDSDSSLEASGDTRHLHMVAGAADPNIITTVTPRTHPTPSLLQYILQRQRRLHGSAVTATASYVTLATMYLLVNVVNFFALLYTPASTSNTLGQAQCAFAMVFSWFLLKEKCSITPVICIAVCLTGVAVITYGASAGRTGADTGGYHKGHELLGVLLMVGFAALWGLYEVLFEKLGNPDSTADVIFILVVFGWVHFLFLWPIVVISNYAGIEHFAFPTSHNVGGLFFNFFVAVTFNISFMGAIELTSPVLVAVASVLNVPLSYFADYLLHGDSFAPMSYLGAGLIIAGFLAMNINSLLEARARAAKENEEALYRAQREKRRSHHHHHHHRHRHGRHKAHRHSGDQRRTNGTGHVAV